MKRLFKTLGIIAALALMYILTVVLYQTRPWVSAESIPDDVDLRRESRTFAPKYQAIAQQWDRQLPLWRQQSHAPSLSIAVGHGGELIWAGVIGYKDLAHKIPAQLDTRYRIGSTSKALTATSLARLYDQRQLSLDAPIQDYLPNYPTSEKPTTLRQLMSHQAGIRHYQSLWLPPFNEYLLNKPFLSVEEGLLLFKDDPRIATPGEEFHYSSYGINLASAVMEKATNRTFLQLMQQEVFDPLAMNHTYGEKESDPKGTQWYQLHGDGKASLAAPVNSSYKWASGADVSPQKNILIQ